MSEGKTMQEIIAAERERFARHEKLLEQAHDAGRVDQHDRITFKLFKFASNGNGYGRK
jgi:hypothetical protein